MNLGISHRLRNQFGLTLVELLIASTIGCVTVLALAALNTQSARQIKQNAVANQIDLARHNLLALILNNSAWTNTKNANQLTATYPIGDMNCLIDGVSACPTNNLTVPPTTLPFAIFDANNNLYYDATNPLQGIDTNGNPCATFVASPGIPTNNCNFRFQLNWTADCANCVNPSLVIISATLIQNSNGTQLTNLNSSAYSLPPVYRSR